jgi:4-carboxymuconolactone decarboxylase
MSVSKQSLAFLALALLVSPPAWAQRVPEARLKPVPAAEWTDAHREALGTRARGDDTLDVFQTCLRNLELCRNWMAFTNYILSDRSSITPRDRELLILRTGYLCRSDYEWAQHAGLGLKVGLTKEELTRITSGPDAAGWSPADATLLRAADELHRDHHISDATWGRLRERFDDRQMMDIIFTVGQYTIVSMYLNSAGVQLEQGQTGIPR